MTKASTWRPQLSMLVQNTPRTTLLFSEACGMSSAGMHSRLQHALIDGAGQLRVPRPRESLGPVLANLRASRLEIPGQVTREIRPNRGGEVERVTGPEDKARLALDDVVLQGTDVGDDDGDALRVRERQHA